MDTNDPTYTWTLDEIFDYLLETLIAWKKQLKIRRRDKRRSKLMWTLEFSIWLKDREDDPEGTR